MSKIDFETKDRLHQLLEDGHITPSEARTLEILLFSGTREEAARRMKIQVDSVYKSITRFIRRGILIRKSRGVLDITDDVITIRRPEDYTPPPPAPRVEEIKITDAERKWMLENYDSKHRSVAARALGREKFEINQMAIALGLDRKY